MFSHKDDSTPDDQLVEKWNPLLENDSVEPIGDYHKKKVTAVLLENQQNALREQAINEQHANAMGGNFAHDQVGAAGNLAGYDPVLISLVRRAMPNLMAYDLCGVQPMTAPTGLIFAIRAKYGSQDGREALFQEAEAFGGSLAATAPGVSAAGGNGLSFAAWEGDTRGTDYLTAKSGDFCLRVPVRAAARTIGCTRSRFLQGVLRRSQGPQREC